MGDGKQEGWRYQQGGHSLRLEASDEMRTRVLNLPCLPTTYISYLCPPQMSHCDRAHTMSALLPRATSRCKCQDRRPLAHRRGACRQAEGGHGHKGHDAAPLFLHRALNVARSDAFDAQRPIDVGLGNSKLIGTRTVCLYDLSRWTR